MIEGPHHNAYRCRDSEETRRFCAGFLGLPLASALPLETTSSGRGGNVLHTFYELGDGFFPAFFAVPGQSFEFKRQHDFDLHIALEVDRATLEAMMARGKGLGHRDARDLGSRLHRFGLLPRPRRLRRRPHHQDRRGARAAGPRAARRTLDEWQAAKARQPGAPT